MNISTTLKNLAGAILLCAIPASAYAAHLSPQEALERMKSSGAANKIPGSQSLALAHTEKAGGESYLYVFNRGTDGFVITSADDRMPAVLGYSDNGAFDLPTASPQLKWWLEQYAAQADSYLSADNAPMNVVSSAPAWHDAVPELMKTRWDQDAPYNTYCPLLGNQHCVTGCVATAMAQVIKYHGYPVTGNSYNTYTWNNKTLVYDYAGAHFNYDDMLDVYDASATDAQKNAVADLMYACGIAVNMNYNQDASGASSYMISHALTEYFNYDKNIRYLKRDYFTTAEWNDIVYEEVAAGRPVIYGGQSGQGGHEFVCDGYQEGYFHINWGWSGRGNGWFLLSALDPGLQGIGGFAGGYNYDQDIICGIQPDTGIPQSTYPIMATGGLSFGQSNRNQVQVSFSGGLLCNFSPVGYSATLYLKAVSQTGEETMGTPVTKEFGAFPLGYGTIAMYIPKVGAGKYDIYLMYMGPQGDLLSVPVPVTGADHLIMTVPASGNPTFSLAEPEVQASIKVTLIEAASDVIQGRQTPFHISMTNPGEYTYSGSINITTYNLTDGASLQNNRIGGLSLYPGESIDGQINLTFNLPEGVYLQRCFDMYGNLCSKDFTLVIGHPSGIPTGISLDYDEKTLTEGDLFALTATVSGDDTADKAVTWASSDPAVATVESGMVTAVAPGVATITATTSNGLTAACDITVEARIVEPSSISLNFTEKTIFEGDTFILTATVSPHDTTDKTVTWTTSDPAVATVNGGVVTAFAQGTATITATTVNGLTATCALTVEEKIILATSISLDQQSIEAPVEATVKLVATVLPDDATDKTVAWSSSDTSVATVDSEGNVTIVAEGTATITASTTDGSDLRAECIVTGLASIADIISESGPVDIYNLGGLLIRKGAGVADFDTLPRGIYIIRSAASTYKLMK